jgi:DNA-binding LacI/PurR family transcriptional regulator
MVSGQLKPGERIPTHETLERRLHVQSPTVRAAMDVLRAEGFIESRHRRGTFVSERPPYLYQYGLVFWSDPKAPYAEQYWSRYFQALTLAATEFERTSGKRVLLFHGVDWHTDSPDRQRLIEHMETQRLAGVVFANVPMFLEHSPILELPGIPRVAFQAGAGHPNVRTVNFDGQQWFDRALDDCLARGHRRVALIEYGGGAKGIAERFRAGVARRGMTTLPRWRQIVSMSNPDGARLAVELLMADRERPDALLINDDNFVEPAVAGLVAAGVRVPACGESCRTEDVAVVGHANFPMPPSKALPVHLLGYDQRVMFRAAVDLIDRCRSGEKVSRSITLPPLWEEEAGAAKPLAARGQKSEVGSQARKRKLEPAVPAGRGKKSPKDLEPAVPAGRGKKGPKDYRRRPPAPEE